MISEWYATALDLERRGETGKSLDVVFQNLDEMLRNGEFREIDEWVGTLDPEGMTVQMALSVLVMTFPASHELENRKSFYDKAYRSISRKGRDAKGLIGGLRAWRPMA